MAALSNDVGSDWLCWSLRFFIAHHLYIDWRLKQWHCIIDRPLRQWHCVIDQPLQKTLNWIKCCDQWHYVIDCHLQSTPALINCFGQWHCVIDPSPEYEADLNDDIDVSTEQHTEQQMEPPKQSPTLPPIEALNRHKRTPSKIQPLKNKNNSTNAPITKLPAWK